MTLPKAPPPSWFVDELVLHPDSVISILDDDLSIHQIWEGRFDKVRNSKALVTHDAINLTTPSLRHFSTPESFAHWVTSVSPDPRRYLHLIDYELLGHSQTGLDWIEQLQLEKQSILVTSHFEEEEVRSRCERLGVRLIPKGLAAFVPISAVPISPPFVPERAPALADLSLE